MLCYSSIVYQSSSLPAKFINMSQEENGTKDEPHWQELKLPHSLYIDTVQELHAIIQNDWDPLQRSACQTAAGRALWKHVIHDPLADLLAGETLLRSFHEKIRNDQLNNAREISGVLLAVRTLWFDSKLEAALTSFRGERQVVILGAVWSYRFVITYGKLTNPYICCFDSIHAKPESGKIHMQPRLSCLKESSVFEVDFPEVLEAKTSLLETAMASVDENQHPKMIAKSLNRVAADIRINDWLEKLQMSGFLPQKNTVWVLEGILYYLSHTHAMQVLNIIADKCALAHTVLLADFMNKPSTNMSNSIFHFYSDWPDQLLPSLGFSHVKLSQIGDPDAHFGLMDDPLNLFNKLRSLPRSMQSYPDDGKPCCRLYLVQASGLPNQTTQ